MFNYDLKRLNLRIRDTITYGPVAINLFRLIVNGTISAKYQYTEIPVILEINIHEKIEVFNGRIQYFNQCGVTSEISRVGDDNNQRLSILITVLDEITNKLSDHIVKFPKVQNCNNENREQNCQNEIRGRIIRRDAHRFPDNTAYCCSPNL
jgi:predicted double-glycine peptidase